MLEFDWWSGEAKPVLMGLPVYASKPTGELLSEQIEAGLEVPVALYERWEERSSPRDKGHEFTILWHRLGS